MQFKWKADAHRHLRVFGYYDLTLSICRHWADPGRNSHPTWRHITVGLRSPWVVYAKATGLAPSFQHLRFGYGSGNLYLGLIYIITTFGRQYPGLEYRKWGPFEWASPKPAKVS